MCRLRMQTDELLDMLTSIARKKSKIRGNLHLQAVLESTQKWLDQELRDKQCSRKRKWEDIRTDYKKSKLDHLDVEAMEVDSNDDALVKNPVPTLGSSISGTLLVLMSEVCMHQSFLFGVYGSTKTLQKEILGLSGQEEWTRIHPKGRQALQESRMISEENLALEMSLMSMLNVLRNKKVLSV